ncbi:hypothetical protein LCGC14_1086250 [marine sediment metagenome]|uniref:DNA binding HTH domain-containing protein n=1 Tax=marine sediment metagenome TaxID=412755 RepID=A0A0F9MI13_9ZZZZ
MAGQQVTTQAITNALLEWRGNVEQTAKALGIRRNSLYERIRRLGLNLEGYRRSVNANVEPVTHVSGVSGVSGHQKASGPARNSHSAPVTQEDKRRRFGRMEAVESADAAGAPINAAPGRIRPPRLRPNQQDRLREAKLDLGARYRIETDESLILQQYFDETFDEWLGEKLAVGTKQTKPARRERTEGGGEGE